MNGKDTLTIIQGDQIPIGVRLEDEDGESITPSAVSEVTISLGSFSHKMTDEVNPVVYDAEEELWMFRITQEETLALTMGVHALAAEVAFADETIDNATVAAVFVLPGRER